MVSIFLYGCYMCAIVYNVCVCVVFADVYSGGMFM